MYRYSFLCKIATVFLFSSFLSNVPVEAKNRHDTGRTFSVDDNVVKIYSPDVKDTVYLMVVSDTHLWMSDAREDLYRQYSQRMAGAYHVIRHFKTGKETTPEEAFEQTVKRARQKNVDVLALMGDIFSYPSEAAIEWAMGILDKSGVPFYYTCGNHDWHYEGMEGSEKELRQTWIENRLLPMFHGKDPLKYYVDVKGVRLVFIDNSIYEILPEQLSFIQEQTQSGVPLVVMMHIPLYAPGRSVDFGCGHPDWNSSTDPSYKIERRAPWPKEGHTRTTLKFYEEVIHAPNILAVFAGHIHSQSIDVIKGLPQFVTPFNAAGGFYDVVIIPENNIYK